LVVVQRLGVTAMKQTRQVLSVRLSAIAFGWMASQGAFADDHESGACVGLPSQAQLKAALVSAVAAETSGLNFQMWATVVDRDGVVCAVAFSGADRGSQWPGSRVISAQKANTANAFSLTDSRYRRPIFIRRSSPVAASTACSTAIRSTPASRTWGHRPATARR